MRCGLIGKKLGHSYSPQIHALLADYDYQLLEMEEEQLAAFFAAAEFDGVNVTIPYKQTVMPYCAEIDAAAQKIGCVNTVVNRGGKLIGYNTDYYGFRTLLHSLCDIKGGKALILGGGASAKTVRAVIEDEGGTAVTISRSGGPGCNYADIACHYAGTQLIVNTTPVGMYPNTLESPLDISGFTALKAVADLVYNPARTKLLLDAERLGIPHANGLLMLAAQAEAASRLFTGTDTAKNAAEVRDIIAAQQQNIVLIGMPGCGKSSLGNAVAARLNRRLVDSDAEVLRVYGRTPEAIIREDGEAAFRECETAVLRELCKQSQLVIATGGGAVTRAENADILRQNGIIVWLQRELAALDCSGRPLSAGEGALEKLAAQRMPLYAALADVCITNDAPAEELAERLLKLI